MDKKVTLSADQVDFLVYLKTNLMAKIYGCRIVIKCPFHNDRAPSFVIDVKKNTFRCLGCSERGTLEELKDRLKPKRKTKVEKVETESIEE